MAGRSYPLAQSVFLDGSGGGQVQHFAPGGGTLVVTGQSVSTSTATKVPTTKVYRNFVAQANYIEGSYTGSNDSSDTRIPLQAGESLICVWAGGDPGASATYRLTAVLYPPGQAPAE